MKALFILEAFKPLRKISSIIKWLKSLDSFERIKLFPYIERLEEGNFNNCKRLKNSIVYELKIDKGPGYRIYYIPYDNNMILLLIGGDKGTQDKDIDKANRYAHNFLEVYNETKYKLSRLFNNGVKRPFA